MVTFLPWSYSAPPTQNQLLNPSLTVSFEQFHWQSHDSSCKEGECHQPCNSTFKCFIPFNQHPVAVCKMYELSLDFCTREVFRRAILTCPTHTTTSQSAYLCLCCTNPRWMCEHRCQIRCRLWSRWRGFRLSTCTALHPPEVMLRNVGRAHTITDASMFYGSIKYKADTAILFQCTCLIRFPPNSSKTHLGFGKWSKENHIGGIYCPEESLCTLYIFSSINPP